MKRNYISMLFSILVCIFLIGLSSPGSAQVVRHSFGKLKLFPRATVLVVPAVQAAMNYNKTIYDCQRSAYLPGVPRSKTALALRPAQEVVSQTFLPSVPPCTQHKIISSSLSLAEVLAVADLPAEVLQAAPTFNEPREEPSPVFSLLRRLCLAIPDTIDLSVEVNAAFR